MGLVEIALGPEMKSTGEGYGDWLFYILKLYSKLSMVLIMRIPEEPYNRYDYLPAI